MLNIRRILSCTEISCFVLFVSIITSVNSQYEYTYGPKCTNVDGRVIITEAGAEKNMYAVLQIHTPQMHRRRFKMSYALKGIGTDPKVDFKRRKTMVFMESYMDSLHMPTGRIFLGNFAAKGYNTIGLDTQIVYSRWYPLAVRTSFQVANITATLLKNLMQYGLKSQDITLVGMSIGGQVAAKVGKFFKMFTGQKVGQILAMDPSGPCYRGLPPEYRLTPEDADMVQVVHTSNDGFGMAEAQGHLDFYINGGEWQFLLHTYQPWCDDLFSHFLGPIFTYISFFVYPGKFSGIKCKSVQQAREHRCYENDYPYETNVMGFDADYNKPGIYYVPIIAEPPLYPPDGWMERKPVYPLIYNDAMSDVEHFVMSERSIDYNLSPPDIINKAIELIG